MFKIEIKTGNAAFADPHTGEESSWDECYEVARILRELADSIESGKREGSCIDINGNKVGKFSFYER